VNSPTDKEIARLLRFIAKGTAPVVETRNRDKLMLESGAHGTISTERSAVKLVLSQGLATLGKGRLSISDAGRAWLRRLECTNDPYAGQHRNEATLIIADESGSTRVRSNDAESPLAMLRKRKDAQGQPLIGDEAFKAGERLRSDFTIGNLIPSIGVNWDVTGSGSRANGVLEITDAALAARQRVEKALAAVGPELSGVLIDVCCFLKGAGNGGTRTAMAGAIGEADPEDRAGSPRPALSSSLAYAKELSDYSLGKRGLPAGYKLKENWHAPPKAIYK